MVMALLRMNWGILFMSEHEDILKTLITYESIKRTCEVMGVSIGSFDKHYIKDEAFTDEYNDNVRLLREEMLRRVKEM